MSARELGLPSQRRNWGGVIQRLRPWPVRENLRRPRDALDRRYLSEGSMTAISADEHADHTTRALSNTPNAADD